MSLTKVTNSMISGAPINVYDFGVIGDGIADDTVNFQAAIDAAVAGPGTLLIPEGIYYITDSLLFDGNLTVYGAGFQKSKIKPASSVLEAVKVGSVSAHQGTMHNFYIERDSYSGATENAGFAFYGSYDSSYYDISSNKSKYNFLFKPGNGQAVAYTQFFNAQGAKGYYNVYWAATGTGYANEVKFYGGRMFTSADTDTNVHWNGGSNNLFDGVSAEGAGTQAFYIGGAGNKVINPRTEGTWSANDIVVDAGALRTFILAHDFYTTITDNGTGTSFITHNSGSQFSSTLNSIAPVTIEYAGATDTTILPIYSSRDNNTSFAWKAIRASDGLVRASCTTNGILYGSRAVSAGQSGYNFYPLTLGNYCFWVDGSGRLRIKNGAPTSDTDGTVVGTQT